MFSRFQTTSVIVQSIILAKFLAKLWYLHIFNPLPSVSFRCSRMFVTYIDLSWKSYSDLSRGVIKLHVKTMHQFLRAKRERQMMFICRILSNPSEISRYIEPECLRLMMRFLLRLCHKHVAFNRIKKGKFSHRKFYFPLRWKQTVTDLIERKIESDENCV